MLKIASVSVFKFLLVANIAFDDYRIVARPLDNHKHIYSAIHGHVGKHTASVLCTIMSRDNLEPIPSVYIILRLSRVKCMKATVAAVCN